jgi:hypothetical protein
MIQIKKIVKFYHLPQDRPNEEVIFSIKNDNYYNVNGKTCKALVYFVSNENYYGTNADVKQQIRFTIQLTNVSDNAVIYKYTTVDKWQLPGNTVEKSILELEKKYVRVLSTCRDPYRPSNNETDDLKSVSDDELEVKCNVFKQFIIDNLTNPPPIAPTNPPPIASTNGGGRSRRRKNVRSKKSKTARKVKKSRRIRK